MTRRPRAPARACQHDGCGRRPAVTLVRDAGVGEILACQRHRLIYEARGWTVLPPGRRPGGDSARTVQLHLRASPAEVAELEAAAGGQPLSVWIREVVLRQVRRPPPSSIETDG